MRNDGIQPEQWQRVLSDLTPKKRGRKESGHHPLLAEAVKVIDVFGNDTMVLVPVNVD